MSQSEQDAPSDSDDDGCVPEGVPFTSESASRAARRSWQSKREKVLKRYGLWETWGAVPPRRERTKPLRSYLPGGDEDE
jgi:hypothetical protein